MRTRNVFIAAASVGALALAAAAPAWAHAVFQNQSVPADSHSELTLNVPVERPAAENSRIEITLPDDFDAHSCTADEGWSCTVDNDKDPEHPNLPQVTFTRLHCPAEGSYRCKMEPAKPDTATAAAQPSSPMGFVRVLHEEGGGGGHDEGGGAPGQTFHFLVHTPAKAGDYHVKVVQHYNTGEIVKWDGEQGSKTPAPMLHVG
jgi:Domain of unkown function (DUF1775)